MAQSNAERQRKQRRTIKGSLVTIHLEIPVEVAAKPGLTHEMAEGSEPEESPVSYLSS